MQNGIYYLKNLTAKIALHVAPLALVIHNHIKFLSQHLIYFINNDLLNRSSTKSFFLSSNLCFIEVVKLLLV